MGAPDDFSSYLASDPDENGEAKAFCPLHVDDNPSASINVSHGVWYCHAGCGGGTLTELSRRIQEREEEGFVPADRDGKVASFAREKRRRRGGGREYVSEAAVDGWRENLLATNSNRLHELSEKRGLSLNTIKAFDIGYDPENHAFTIPIYDADGELLNVRRYRPATEESRSRYWNVPGAGRRRLWPESVLEAATDEILVVEGEWDALLTIQAGFYAVTATGGAGSWRKEWGPRFAGKRVVIIYDSDKTGLAGARQAANNISSYASEVKVVRLPYDEPKDGGEDLTDYFVRDGMNGDDLRELIDGTEPSFADEDDNFEETVSASVLDSFDASLAQKQLRMVTTITGKRNPPYHVPATARYQCTMDAGQKCLVCPLYNLGGDATVEIDRDNPLLLEMMDVPKKQLNDVLRRILGAVKCDRLNITANEQQEIEELFARPSVDSAESANAEEYINRKVLSVGKHDTSANTTVEVTGYIHPNPRTQRAEFLAHEVAPTESSIDAFDPAQAKDLCERFQPEAGQSPLKKAGEIARDLETNVTNIYGRTALHVACDLVWHSLTSFPLVGSTISKGWLELLVVGDTRTGKSSVASSLAEHYSAGRIISCESASYAGIVGGLQQFGAGKEWTITWGAIPLNDKRLVVLDEVAGLTREQISQMSSIRSSGVAQLTKIQSEATRARTRLIWMSNPRDGKLSDYTYAIHAIPELIGNQEDIARFDLAMSVATDDVDLEEINRREHESVPHRYTAEASHALILWAWSRTADDVVWADGAESAILERAIELGREYVEDPPLIQGANVRIKLARIAVALAARTFSTDESYEKVVVTTEHVEDAVRLINWLYQRESFGYHRVSQEAIADRAAARERSAEIARYLREQPNLAKFLRSVPGGFSRQDLEDMTNKSREEAQSTINKLWNARMVRQRDGRIRLTPELQEIVRDTEV